MSSLVYVVYIAFILGIILSFFYNSYVIKLHNKKRDKELDEMREAMKKRDDYHSMPLPRSFAQTVSKILSFKKRRNKGIDVEGECSCYESE